MTEDGVYFIQWLFSNFWRFFNSWYIPGTAITPAAAMLGLIVIPLSIKLVVNLASGTSAPTDAVKSGLIFRSKIKKQ